ncbi:MAG: glycerol acyltransferase [Marinilabiliales bacterium]|nr:MAG: glycerol acyltransferase [Marinilabiliales bacterium]
MQEDTFDLIRPYTDEEVRKAVPRIISDPAYKPMMNFLFDEEQQVAVTEGLKNSSNVMEFQRNFTLPCIQTVVEKTSDKTSCTGLSSLDKDKSYLFIANHRDIALDSSILGLHMINNGLTPPSIAWGNNLELSQFIVDLGKCNQMITVFRDGSPKEILRNSQRLSLYINNVLASRERSVWIAQSKGRTKDGKDHVDASILKMLILSGNKNVKQALKNLNLIPVTISYELEPCGAMKVREVFLSKQEGAYVKDENEDLQSILGGFMMHKGRINVDIGRPINNLIDEIDESLTNNEIVSAVASIIDSETHQNYKLWPTNYLAYDYLENTSEYSDYYDDNTKEQLEKRCQAIYEIIDDDKDTLRKLFYQMYANPVYSKLKK